jgi:hypothetical protein
MCVRNSTTPNVLEPVTKLVVVHVRKACICAVLCCAVLCHAGDEVIIGGTRDGPKLSFGLLDAARPSNDSSSSSSSSCPSTHSETCQADQMEQHLQQQQQERVAVCPAPRPPWLRPGAGIEDPAVWSVKKCQQLLGQMLQRAPGAKFPPIYKDLELMQVDTCTIVVLQSICAMYQTV